MTFYLNNVILLSSCLEIKLNLTLTGLKMLHLMWKYLNSDDKIDAKIAYVAKIASVNIYICNRALKSGMLMKYTYSI